MLLNYQYRAYPDSQQKVTLNEWYRSAMYWYNRQLGDRFDWWEHNRSAVNVCPLTCSISPVRDRPNFYDQKKQLVGLKKDLIKVNWSGELVDLSKLPSWTLQDISKRVKKTFDRFVSGDKNGKRSGKPRFKSASRFKTLGFWEPGIEESLKHADNRLAWVKLPKLKRWVKIRYHRPIPDGFVIKQVMTNKKADGLYLTLVLEDKSVPEVSREKIDPNWENSLGFDAVLKNDDFVATSEGEKLPSVKSFRRNQKRLEKVSRKKSSQKKGSRCRRRLAKQEAREHLRIARSRKDHHFKTAHSLVRTGKKFFFAEDLNLKGLTKRNQPKISEEGKYLPNHQSAKSGLNKSWNDAGFGQFLEILGHIAGNAGGRVVKVKPAHTSQLLCYRDEFVFMTLDEREWYDSIERLCVDRDINAAINIKRVGLGLFPTIKRLRGNSVVTKSTTNSTSKEALAVLHSVQGWRSDQVESVAEPVEALIDRERSHQPKG
jgi:putative transposase